MSDQSAHDISKHLKVYIGVFVALLIGTLLTVAASKIHFGHEGNIIVALVIAVLKAGLVALFFMHLVSEKKSIYMVLVFTAFFFVGLMFLTLWAMHDFPVLPLK
jgi:cytochrome c oxidase subunit 4